MLELCADSDAEIGTETLNSSQSSMSSSGSCERCSTFSRLSFDAAATTVPLELPDSRPQVSCKPHRSSDPAWAAIRARRGGLPLGLGPRDFKLVRRIGRGDIGTVYLCRLRDAASQCAYAMKVIDKQEVEKKGKLGRAEAERRILRSLDHPFLPTLYAEFDATPHYSCVVMEYCSGGDLHSLRHRQPGHRFSYCSARFYAAEVLLALEYLHMLGVVYRDLKPENILIRSDGHIMLSDFDLSLEATSSPSLEQLGHVTTSTADSSPADPSCLPDRLFWSKKPATTKQVERLFVAEPVEARSCSFVGTHEYVAPEVASGRTHGSAVDWWAYGIFLYELLYGRTPFAGPTNEATLRNIVKQPLAFPPAHGPSDAAARDLITGLLDKDPTARLGSRHGAADVKAHPFFKGLKLALLRSYRPPVVPCMERHKTTRFDCF